MPEQRVQFPSGPLTLEGVWHFPEVSEAAPAVVVCHPHPLYGGDMDNGIVVAVCRQLARQGINALRFNFRGVGQSSGAFGEGLGEQGDLMAALSYAESQKFVERSGLGVCGYSFGAGVVLSVSALRKRLKALAAISPPLFLENLERLEDFPGHKLFIAGHEDTLFSALELSRFVNSLPEPRECHIVPGADHFWMGFEEKVAQIVADFFTRTFN